MFALTGSLLTIFSAISSNLSIGLA
jgi:hypothetical protein